MINWIGTISIHLEYSFDNRKIELATTKKCFEVYGKKAIKKDLKRLGFTNIKIIFIRPPKLDLRNIKYAIKSINKNYTIIRKYQDEINYLVMFKKEENFLTEKEEDLIIFHRFVRGIYEKEIPNKTWTEIMR